MRGAACAALFVLPRESLNQGPEQAKICPLKVQGRGFVDRPPPPYSTSNQKSFGDHSAQGSL